MTPSDADRLDGFLQAIATLKDDGTAFRCVWLGAGEPTGKAAEVEARFGLAAGSVELACERARLSAVNLPESLERWCLDRIRPMNDLVVEPRLVSGLADEVADLFQRAPAWYQARCSDATSHGRLGAIWTLYVFGLAPGSFALLCSWDS